MVWLSKKTTHLYLRQLLFPQWCWHFQWSANLTAAYVPQPPDPSDDGALLLVGDNAGPLHAIDVKSGAIKLTFFG